MSLGLMITAAVALLASFAGLLWRKPILAYAIKSHVYLGKVREEVHKVSWPTWEDLRKSTGVIIVIVVIVGAIIGLMDLLFSWVLIDVFSRLFGR